MREHKRGEPWVCLRGRPTRGTLDLGKMLLRARHSFSCSNERCRATLTPVIFYTQRPPLSTLPLARTTLCGRGDLRALRPVRFADDRLAQRVLLAPRGGGAEQSCGVRSADLVPKTRYHSIYRIDMVLHLSWRRLFFEVFSGRPVVRLRVFGRIFSFVLWYIAFVCCTQSDFPDESPRVPDGCEPSNP